MTATIVLPDDRHHERQLTHTAAAAAGHARHPLVTHLDDAADRRRLPGPVITDQRDHIAEGILELIDARNYFVWAARTELAVMHADETDSAAHDRYSAAMTALSAVVTGYIAAVQAPRMGTVLSDADRDQRIQSLAAHTPDA